MFEQIFLYNLITKICLSIFPRYCKDWYQSNFWHALISAYFCDRCNTRFVNIWQIRLETSVRNEENKTFKLIFTCVCLKINRYISIVQNTLALEIYCKSILIFLSIWILCIQFDMFHINSNCPIFGVTHVTKCNIVLHL